MQVSQYYSAKFHNNSEAIEAATSDTFNDNSPGNLKKLAISEHHGNFNRGSF